MEASTSKKKRRRRRRIPLRPSLLALPKRRLGGMRACGNKNVSEGALEDGREGGGGIETEA